MYLKLIVEYQKLLNVMEVQFQEERRKQAEPVMIALCEQILTGINEALQAMSILKIVKAPILIITASNLKGECDESANQKGED